ncbi:MAG: hypothetical protein Q9160_000876 [Pyrenula sp. 1 TL-2023]
MEQESFAQQALLAPTMWVPRAAIVALYIRIFGSLQWLRLTSYGILVCMFLLFGSNTLVAALYCIPRGGAPWDYDVMVRCGKPISITIVIGTFAVAIDLVLFVLPFPVIYKLQLNRRKKIGLSIVFLLGFLTVVTSVTSFVYRIKIFLGVTDGFWGGTQLCIVSFAEAYGATIVSCAPAMHSFWSKILPNTKLPPRRRAEPLPSRSPLKSGRFGDSEHPGEWRPDLTHKGSFAMLEEAMSKQPAGPRTTIYASADEPIPLQDGITKSCKIQQIINTLNNPHKREFEL